MLPVPAMNGKMWTHPATPAALKARGVEFIGPKEGVLACSGEGIGRLWAVESIVDRVIALLAS